jgi:hypothetical protein
MRVTHRSPVAKHATRAGLRISAGTHMSSAGFLIGLQENQRDGRTRPVREVSTPLSRNGRLAPENSQGRDRRASLPRVLRARAVRPSPTKRRSSEIETQRSALLDLRRTLSTTSEAAPESLPEVAGLALSVSCGARSVARPQTLGVGEGARGPVSTQQTTRK